MKKDVLVHQEIDYIDGNGNKYHFNDCIIIDVACGRPLEELLEEALELVEKENKEKPHGKETLHI